LRRVSFSKVKRYHVSVVEIEQRTAIDFGAAVRAADTHPGGERREVHSLNDLTAALGVATRTGTKANARAARKRSTPKRKP
jgi:endonuclease G